MDVFNVQATESNIMCATGKVHCNLKTDKSCQNLMKCLKNWYRNRKLRKKCLFFTNKAAGKGTGGDSDWHAMQRSREGGMGERVMEEDFKLTPLWIFPTTVYYNTVSLNTVCLWKWNQDKSVTEKRNPKEVTLSFGHLLCEEAAGSKG